MAANRWLDRTQPQTLQNATLLSYLNGGIAVITGAILSPLGLLIVAGSVGGGWGIANEKKWGYWLSLVTAGVVVLLQVLYFSIGTVVNLLFWIALVALLLHPQSRDYRRTWFR